MDLRPIWTVNPHFRSAVSVQYSPNGQFIAVASADKSLTILNSDTGILVTRLEGHSHGLNDCIWLSDQFVASCSDDQTTKIWHLDTQTVVNNWKDAKSFVCSMTLDENTGVIYSGGYDGCIRGYHVYHKDPLFSVSAHSEPIVSIDSSNHLGRLVSGAQDGFAREWDIANPSACYKTIVSRSRGEDIPISSVCYAPLNAKYTLVSSLDSMHRFYTDDNIAEGDDSYRISESNSSEKIKLLKTYSGHQNKSFCLKSRVISVESGDYVVSGSEDSKVYIWELISGELISTLQCTTGSVMSVDIREEGEELSFIAASSDGTVKAWSGSSLKRVPHTYTATQSAMD